jgi:hypothetical protein
MVKRAFEKRRAGVIARRPECYALSIEVETGSASRSVIPAQAGIQCSAPGFRVSPCSPGMTGVSFSSFQRKLESRGCWCGLDISFLSRSPFDLALVSPTA